jgi:hypothetical protein
MLEPSFFGLVALLIALPVALYAAIAGPLSERLRVPALLSSARNGVLAVAVLLTTISPRL